LAAGAGVRLPAESCNDEFIIRGKFALEFADIDGLSATLFVRTLFTVDGFDGCCMIGVGCDVNECCCGIAAELTSLVDVDDDW
jgi:hypothetical protein